MAVQTFIYGRKFEDGTIVHRYVVQAGIIRESKPFESLDELMREYEHVKARLEKQYGPGSVALNWHAPKPFQNTLAEWQYLCRKTYALGYIYVPVPEEAIR